MFPCFSSQPLYSEYSYKPLVHLLILVIIFISYPSFAQQTAGSEDDFFFSLDKRIPVRVALDQIGIVAYAEANPKDVQKLAAQFDLQLIKELPANSFIFGLRKPLKRLELVRLTRQLKKKDDQGRIVKEAGLVVTTHVDSETPIFITDEFIALFKPDVTRERIIELNKANGVEIVGPDHFVKNQFLLRVSEETKIDVLTISNRYHENAITEFSHPNFWTLEERFETLPTDPLFGNQWHHRNSGQNGGLVDADADTSWAWDLGMGNANVVIAVIDDGFDLTHEDLAPNLFTNPGEVAGNGIDDDGNGFIDDVNGWDFAPCGGGVPAPGCGDNNPSPASANDNHGTAVAGVATAQGGNALGVVGSCSNCSILPIRRGYGMFSEQAKANAFAYAQAMGANIINNSWGHTSTAGTVATVTANAINNAAAAGVLIFFAGGNANSSGWCASSYPSLNNSVIAVSSSTNQDRKVTAAAFGNCIDILAPSHRGYNPPYNGTLNVTTTDRTGAAGYNNANPSATPCPIAEPGTNYSHCFGGTSSASPLTAGVAGLILSADNTLTRIEVQRLIQDTADKIVPGTAAYADSSGFSTPVSGIATHSWGRLNAFEAVQIVAPVASGGKGGVDIFVRDNRLDWGNTEQSSNTRFESPRGFIGHWRSVDIKVDAPPYQPAPTAATFDAFPDETPSAVAGEINRIYVRVRNRGPEPASSVTVKLYWAQFGTGLPPLPPDFWTAFPANSSDPTSKWNPLNCAGTASSSCTLTNIGYSGSSVAGTAADVAQIAQFDFPAPLIDPSLPNHFCLLAMIDSTQDPISSDSKASFVVDAITPTDNNVTHRNYQDLYSGETSSFIQRFFVRNPSRERVRAVLRLAAPKGWKVDLDRFAFGTPFSLEPEHEELVTLHLVTPALKVQGDVTVSQESLVGKNKVIGGVTFRVRPFEKPPVGKRKLILLVSYEDLIRRQAILLEEFGKLIKDLSSGDEVSDKKIISLVLRYEQLLKMQAEILKHFGSLADDYRDTDR